MILGFVLIVLGFILLFFSVHFGMSLADDWIVKQGGADPSTYLFVMEGYTNSFLVAGGILFSIGLSVLIFVYYKILTLKEKDNK